ncbi:MAG: cytidylate kinase-like family protein [Oscillospiraceae bacterium]|nr:cytidylate kinase-like family protein [Oscillospiraceae bacterium]
MNKIITIGREFGSGGRELGKRLAEKLGFAYYDVEIVSAIARRSSLADDYVNQVLEQRIRTYYPITVANTLAVHQGDALFAVTRTIYAAQTEIIREMAEKSDCVIVGRCGDYILADKKPFRLFVYADLAARIARCRANGEDMRSGSDRELEKKIRVVDRSRAQYYRFYTGQTWGDKFNYDLCVNAAGLDLSIAANGISALVNSNG